MLNKKLISILVLLLVSSGLAIKNQDEVGDVLVGAFNTTRGFATLPSSTTTQATHIFGAVNIGLERPGLASNSGGFELGKLNFTSETAISVASTSAGFAITVNEAGKVRGCAFDLQTVPTTGSVAIMVQKNATLQTGVYCRLPRSGTFATQGQLEDMSTSEVITDDITFVAGDRLGLIASSSNLNAATFDGTAKLILQLSN